MTNTSIQSSGTYAGAPRAGAAFRSFVFMSSLLLVWVSISPFKGNDASDFAASNLGNQIGFSSMAIMAVAALRGTDAKLLRSFLRPSWLILVMWMTIGVFTSQNFDASLRALLFFYVVATITGAMALLPTGKRHFARMIGSVTLIILGINYFGLIAWPDLAIHTVADRAEPEHAGSWRGMFDHKNIAGSMMGIFVFVGIFVFRAHSRLAGGIITVLALIFLFNTASKTAIGAAPSILVISTIAIAVRNRHLRTIVALGPLIIMLTFTLGSVVFKPVNELLQSISPGQTFTGRAEIWGFALDRLSLHPLLGFGLEGFWGSDFVKYAETSEYETGISSDMPHAHNGYLDSAINFGIIGLIIVLYALIIAPMRDYNAARQYPENNKIADLMLQIWLFCLYSACLESFFFRRADPVWFSMFFAMVYIRFLSKFRAIN